jgi:hypothetical protein
MRYFIVPQDEFSVVNHPLQPEFLHWHILSAPLLVFAIGLIWSGHVLTHYRRNTARGRRTGLTLAATAFPMIFSGYALQVSVNESWTEVWMWLHLATAGIWLFFAVIHPFLPTPDRVVSTEEG